MRSIVPQADPFSLGRPTLNLHNRRASATAHAVPVVLPVARSVSTRDEDDCLFDLELPDVVRGRRSISMDGYIAQDSVDEALALLRDSQSDRFISQLFVKVKNAEDCSSEANFQRRLELVGQRLCMQGYRVSFRSRKGGGSKSDCMMNMSHQFLVVIEPKLEQEIIVEISFRSHFLISNPPKSYREILARVPDVFVGTRAMLENIAGKLAKEMKRAFAEMGQSTPPWREKGSILSKWKPEGCLEQGLHMQMCDTRHSSGPHNSKLLQNGELSKSDQDQLIPASRHPQDNDDGCGILQGSLFH